METTIVSWGHIGMMEKNMETTIVFGFLTQRSGKVQPPPKSLPTMLKGPRGIGHSMPIFRLSLDFLVLRNWGLEVQGLASRTKPLIQTLNAPNPGPFVSPATCCGWWTPANLGVCHFRV